MMMMMMEDTMEVIDDDDDDLGDEDLEERKHSIDGVL